MNQWKNSATMITAKLIAIRRATPLDGRNSISPKLVRKSTNSARCRIILSLPPPRTVFCRVSNSFHASAKGKYGSVSEGTEVITGCRSKEKIGVSERLLNIGEIIAYCKQMLIHALMWHFLTCQAEVWRKSLIELFPKGWSSLCQSPDL